MVCSPTFTIAWHPSRYLLAYACDDKDKYDRDRDAGSLKVCTGCCSTLLYLSLDCPHFTLYIECQVWGFPSD